MNQRPRRANPAVGDVMFRSRPTLAKRRLAVVHASNRKWSFVQIMILTKVVVEGAVVMTIEDANIAAMREIFRAHIINRRDSGS